MIIKICSRRSDWVVTGRRKTGIIEDMNSARIINFVNNCKKEHRNILLFLFGIAFLIRLVVVFSIDYPFNETRINQPTQDPVVYYQLALSILDGDGMKSGEPGQRTYDFRRTPLYPLFLAGIIAIFGEGISYVQGFQILIGALTVVLFYLLCLEYFNKRISFISALIFALYLPHAALSVAIMAEIWTTFFIASTLLFITRAYKQNSLTYWLLSGFSYSCLILNRQCYKFALIFIVLAIFVLYFRRNEYLFRNLIAFAILLILFVVPWMYYVKSATGKIQFDTFIDDVEKTHIDVSTSPLFLPYLSIIWTEKELGYYKTPEEKKRFGQDIEESKRMDTKTLIVKAVNHVRKYPGRFLKVVLHESQFLWVRSFVISGTNRGNMLLDLSPLMKKHYLHDKNYKVLFVNFLTALFALAGIVGFIRFGLMSFPMAFAVLFTVAGFTFYFASDRYGLPVHNFIILYAVAAIDWIWRNVKSRLQTSRSLNSN